MVIYWVAPDKTLANPESLNPDEWLGHTSYITMQDDTSYSWDGTAGTWTQWRYSERSPSSIYTDERSKESSGTGEILDFGSQLNTKFQYAMEHAYDGIPVWDPYYHNCTYGFQIGLNAIAKDLGLDPVEFHKPSNVDAYIRQNLAIHTMRRVVFPKR
jgi:hypothetical protein